MNGSLRLHPGESLLGPELGRVFDFQRFIVQHGVLAFVGALLAGSLCVTVVIAGPWLAALFLFWSGARRAAGRGDLVRSERYLHRAMVVARFLDFGAEKAMTGEAAFRLACNMLAQKRPADAARFGRRAFACFKFGSRQKAPIAHATLLLAHIDVVGGDCEDGEALESGLTLWRECGAKPHFLVPVALVSLARQAHRGGRFDEALGFLEEAVEIGERTGDRGMHAVDPLIVRARVLGILGRRDEAERDLRQALGIVERALGREHRVSAVVLRQLAAILHEKGQTSASDQLLARAVAIESGSPSGP